MIDENIAVADRIICYIEARIALGIKASASVNPNAGLIRCEQFIRGLDYDIREYFAQHGTLPPEILGRRSDKYVREVMDAIMGADLAEEFTRKFSRPKFGSRLNKGVNYEKEGVRDAW